MLNGLTSSCMILDLVMFKFVKIGEYELIGKILKLMEEQVLF